jgi:hypothetical protein
MYTNEAFKGESQRFSPSTDHAHLDARVSGASKHWLLSAHQPRATGHVSIILEWDDRYFERLQRDEARVARRTRCSICEFRRIE